MRITLNTKILIEEGKRKPVVNLITKKLYMSSAEAVRKEGSSLHSIMTSCKTGEILPNGFRYAYIDSDGHPILTKGHKKDIYMKNSTRKIKNIITGIIYNSLKEASEDLNISIQALSNYARGKYSVARGKYVFCYLDESGKEILTEKHNRGLEIVKNNGHPKYVAWNINDHDKIGDVLKKQKFNTLKELCASLGIKNKAHVKNVCDGFRNHVEGWKIAFIDINGEEILKDSHKRNIAKLRKKVICLNDNKIFNTPADAGRYYSISDEGISHVAKGKSKSVYHPKTHERLRFAYLTDNDDPILTAKHLESLERKGRFQYLVKKGDEETICNSLSEISSKFKISLKRLQNHFSGKVSNLGGLGITRLHTMK